MSPFKIAIAITVLILIVMECGVFLSYVNTPSDPDKAKVEKWLKSNVATGKWEEVQWYPLVTLKGIRCQNAIKTLNSIKYVLDQPASMPSKEEIEAQRKYWKDFMNRPVQRICGIRYRTANPFGATGLFRQVFEIHGDTVTPIDQTIYEFPEEASRRSAKAGFPEHTYDAWELLSDPKIDAALVISDAEIEAKVKETFTIRKRPEINLPAVAHQIPNVQPIQRQPQLEMEEPRENGLGAIAEFTRQLQLRNQNNPPVNQPKLPIQRDAPPPAEKSDQPIILKESPDAVPKNVREYFDRCAESKGSLKAELEKKSKSLEIAIRGALPVNREGLRSQLTEVNKKLVELNKSKLTAYMPSPPKFGDIGSFKAMEVMAIIDEETLIVGWSTAGYYNNYYVTIDPTFVIITPIKTKGIKVGKPTFKSDLFQITGTREAPLPIMDHEDVKVAVRTPVNFVAKPVKKHEIEEFRERYQKENADKK